MGRDSMKSRSDFPRRALLPRAVGLPVGALCLTVPLWELQRSVWVWSAVALFAFAWPWVAFRLSQMHKNPARAERRYVSIDSFCASLAIAAAGFSPMASAVIFAMMLMNNVATGGIRFVALAFLVQLLGAMLGILLFGAQLHTSVSPLHIYACIPMLVLHPLVVGLTLYRLALNVAKSRQELRALSQIDGLTGLCNRRHWTALADAQFMRCERGGEGACLALIDLDHFKNVNDTQGHLAGDQLLRDLGKALRVHLRQVDMPGRYGGDEFCVLLPMTDSVNAVVVLERLRHRLLNTLGSQVSLSIGVAPYDVRMQSLRDWIKAADRALYLAKEQGRNQVVCERLKEMPMLALGQLKISSLI
jgi:diguanylate cyclase